MLTLSRMDDQPQVPVFLDLLSGPHFPLAQAFEWAGWKIVQPIDLLIDSEFDSVKPSVQKAINAVLPQCHLVSAASVPPCECCHRLFHQESNS